MNPVDKKKEYFYIFYENQDYIWIFYVILHKLYMSISKDI